MNNPICLAYLPDDHKPCGHYLKQGLCDHPSFFRCIEFIRVHEPILSYSSMQSFMCHRKFYYSYILGIEPLDKAMPLKLGSLASLILDQVHSKTLNLEKVKVRSLMKWDNKEGNQDNFDTYDYRVEALISVLQAYVDLGKHNEKGKTQCEFRYFEPEMPQIHGFIDMLGYEENIGFEFKYTSNPDAYSKFTLEDQLSTYFLAHPTVQRFTVRTILNPVGTLKLGKNEQVEVFAQRVYMDALARPKHYFHDQSYWRNEFDLDEHRAKIKSIAMDIVALINRGKGQIYAFRKVNTPHTCYLMSNKNTGPSPCEFLSCCSTGVISETLYKRRKNRENVIE